MFKSLIEIILSLLLSFDLFAQQEVFVTDAIGDLYSLDLYNCTKTFVGSTGIGFGDIAFTTNNELWGVSNGNLYHIDKGNGSVDLITTLNISPVSLVGVNDTLLVAEFQKSLYSIHTISGQVSLIDYVGYVADGDLIWDGSSLFMLTPFVEIKLNKNLSEIEEIIDFNTTIPISEGAVLFGENLYTIVGFGNSQIYQLCMHDGSFEIICSNIDLQNVPGAASTVNQLNNFSLINIFTPNSDGVNDEFLPNLPLTEIESIEIINRWGEKIIELKEPFVWDGTNNNGKQINDGIYYYYLKPKGECMKKKFETEIIYLIK